MKKVDQATTLKVIGFTNNNVYVPGVLNSFSQVCHHRQSVLSTTLLKKTVFREINYNF